jgi:hypothetical protein
MAFKEQEFNISIKEEKAFSSSPLGSYRKNKPIKSYFDISGGTDVLNLSAQASEEERAGTATINFDAIDRSAVAAKQFAIGYSEGYLKIKIAQFVAAATPLLEEWSSNVGTPSELKPIKNLLKLIEDSGRFFDVKPSSRLLLGTVQNFLIKWGKLEARQIKHFSTLLNWFSEGEVEKDKVKSFSQQVFLISDNNIEDDEEISEEK